MKKLILILIFVFTSLLSFSQETPLFLRAEKFKAGMVDNKHNVLWDETTLKECDILIKLEDSQATIYSKTLQTYRVISMVNKTSDGSQWYCLDSNGTKCYLYLTTHNDSPNKLILGIEYCDYVWCYVCRLDNN